MRLANMNPAKKPKTTVPRTKIINESQEINGRSFVRAKKMVSKIPNNKPLIHPLRCACFLA